MCSCFVTRWTFKLSPYDPFRFLVSYIHSFPNHHLHTSSAYNENVMAWSDVFEAMLFSAFFKRYSVQVR